MPYAQARSAASACFVAYKIRSSLSTVDDISDRTYTDPVSADDKPLLWLHGEIKTPPFSRGARIEAGFLLRRLQRGETLTSPHSRPMPSIGPRCHELRINDVAANWRIVYRIEEDAIVLLEVFRKTTARTPPQVIDVCKARLRGYESA
jgi:phage-related protein